MTNFLRFFLILLCIGAFGPLYGVHAQSSTGFVPLVQLEAKSPESMPVQIPMADPAGKKSRTLAVVYSLLLPGMGELYAERFDRGIYPLVLEGALWLGFAGFNAYGASLQTDSRTFAVQHAGADIAGKGDQYFVDIANYMNTREYNQAKLVDRNLAALYSEEPGSAYLWQWSSEGDRQKYKSQRTLSESMFNNSKFVVLGMIANRIWSAIQAAAFARDYNNANATAWLRRVEMRSELTSFAGRTDGVRLHLSAPF